MSLANAIQPLKAGWSRLGTREKNLVRLSAVLVLGALLRHTGHGLTWHLGGAACLLVTWGWIMHRLRQCQAIPPNHFLRLRSIHQSIQFDTFIIRQIIQRLLVKIFLYPQTLYTRLIFHGLRC